MAQSQPEKLSVDQVLKLVDKLSAAEQVELRQKLGIKVFANRMELPSEAEAWLDADLVEELDPFQWTVTPVGVPVQYVQKVGFMINEDSA